MLVFNAYLFPPVTCIIYLSSVTILAWRTKSSVESVTLCGKTNFLCDSDWGVHSLLSVEKLSFIQQQFAFIGD